MKPLNRLGSNWNRQTRNEVNENWDIIENSVNGAGGDSSVALNKANEALSKSNEATNKSDVAINTAQNVQQQLNELIIESGTSDAEVVQSRGGYPVLNARLDEKEQTFTEGIEELNKNVSAFVNVEQFDNLVPNKSAPREDWDWSAAITYALTNYKWIEFGPNVYKTNERIVLNDHLVKGAASSDTFRSTTKIIFSGLPSGTESCVHCQSASVVNNIIFLHDTWDNSTQEINGLTIDRMSIFNQCAFNYFPGHGALLYRRSSSPDLSPYHSQFNNCSFDYNKKHGAVIGNGANTVSFINPQARWNGSISYGVAPTLVGTYDGIYVDGEISYLPEGLKVEPQGTIILGGNLSYNSRYGLNLRQGNDGLYTGIYLENNISGSDYAIDESYGTVISNLAAKSIVGTVTTPLSVSGVTSRNIRTYPNHIISRGRDLGNGLINKYDKPWGLFTAQHLSGGPIFSASTDNLNFIFDKEYGGTGVNQSFVKLTDLIHLNAKNAVFGTATPNTEKGIWFHPPQAAENEAIASFINGAFGTTQDTRIYSATGANASTQQTAMRIKANSTTSRSINAGGTVNASGADYAEYMKKSISCGEISKGDIVGINSNGEITDIFSESISFAVKSTNPSFVGGDIWSNNLTEPKEPLKGEYNDQEYEEAMIKYHSDLNNFNVEMEILRSEVDRIAFSGICPVNIYDFQVGDYIVPVNDNDKIKPLAVNENDITFSQYKKAIGKVISVEDDQRASVIVKII